MGSACGRQLDRDPQVERGGDLLERRESGAHIAGFEAGHRGLAGADPGGELSLAETGDLACAANLLADVDGQSGYFGRSRRKRRVRRQSSRPAGCSSLHRSSGVPSIVFGLFGNAFFCKTLGLGFSILSGGLTLACMVLPILIRSTEEGFRAVPTGYRLSAAALGLSRTTTLFHLLLPAAVPGLLVGLVLGMGRAIAETAALIFTSGYVDRMPESLLDSGRALSIHIFDLSMNVSGGDANAYASALVLIVLLLAINGTASWLAEHWLHRRIVTI